MKLKLIVGLVVAVAAAGMVGSAEAQSKRPTIAVMDFDYGTIDNWWGQYDIGKGMADQVVDGLLEDGTLPGDRAQEARHGAGRAGLRAE